jgi:hypothetical protein
MGTAGGHVPRRFGRASGPLLLRKSEERLRGICASRLTSGHWAGVADRIVEEAR